MRIQDLAGKKICLLGYGREGKAMHRALNTFAPGAKITIADSNPNIKADDAELQLGPNYLQNLGRFDAIVRSPGVPMLPQLQAIKPLLTDMTRIFFDTVYDSGVKIIGVTGSKGKSTTSNLIYHALKAANENTFLMGNIGLPMIDFLPQAKPGATFVIELSSYMLEFLQRSPHIAVITSFFAEHLNRHRSLQDYWQAKRNIVSHQTAHDAVIYNADYAECKKMADSSPGKKVPFTANDFPMPVNQTQLKGEHNRSNLAAAYKVAQLCGVPDDVALKALQKTPGLPYRLNSIGTFSGIEWVEDSLATAPEATLFALKALGDDVGTLITGGMDRGGYDFAELGRFIAASSIQNVVLFPETGGQIKQAIEAAGPDPAKNYLETTNMKEAVEFAREHTKKGSICLLSNASPSYNMFKDHEEKAKQFIEAVKG